MISSKAFEQDVRRRIIEAFGDVQYPGDNAICSAPPERIAVEPALQHLISAFRHQDWRTLDSGVLEHYCDDLPLFTAQALRYFLPAFLILSLDSLPAGGDVIPFPVPTLNPADSNGAFIPALCRKFGLFTVQQAKAVAEFLHLVANEASDDSLKAHASTALQYYWSDWLTAGPAA